MKAYVFCLANKLYEHCYPVYYPLYAAWKAVSDRRERRLFRSWVKPAMTVVDIGANIGIYTRFFSKLVGPLGRIHAFEPDPSNFKRLEENAGHLLNISLTHAAVGDCRGTIKLYISDEMNVDHRTFDSGDGRRSIDVPLVSLDDYFAVGQRVDLIKIDVQGYELSVLEGAKRVLKENRDIKIVMEFWPYGLTKASVAPNRVIELIHSLGFEIRTTRDPVGCPCDCSKLDPDNIDHYCNLILTRHPRCLTTTWT